MFEYIKKTIEAEVNRESLCSHHGHDALTSFRRINCDDILDRCALLKAAASGNIEEINSLLTRGVNIDARKSVIAHILRIFDKILYPPEAGACKNTSNEPNLNLTPLHLAAMNGHLGIVALLVSKGANVNARISDTMRHIDGIQPIHLAAGCGNKEIFDVLVQAGASINVTSTGGLTPLHFAAAQGCEDIVKSLIAQGADFSSKTRYFNFEEKIGAHCIRINRAFSWTPLHFAMNGKQYYVAKKLLLAAVGLENDYIGPVELAEDDFFGKVVEFLTTLDVSLEIYRLQQLFELAVRKKCLRSVKILLERGININAESNGKTPLHHAIENCHNPTVNLDIIKVLLQHGANPNLKDCNKRTPLDYTIMHDRELYSEPYDGQYTESVIHLLLQRGCSEDTIRRCLNLVGSRQLISLPVQPLKLIIRYYLADEPRKEKPQYLRSECYSSICSDWDICFAELEKMKEKYFGSNLSLYSIFTERDQNKTCVYAKNEEIVKYCKSDDCKNNYPMYTDLILKKLEEGQEKEGLSDKLVKLKISSEASKDITLKFDGQLNVCSASPVTLQKIYLMRSSKRVPGISCLKGPCEVSMRATTNVPPQKGKNYFLLKFASTTVRQLSRSEHLYNAQLQFIRCIQEIKNQNSYAKVYKSVFQHYPEKYFNLDINMRANNDSHHKWPSQIGNDEIDHLEVPSNMLCSTNIIKSLYPEGFEDYFKSNVLLASKNCEVNNLNDEMLAELPRDIVLSEGNNSGRKQN